MLRIDKSYADEMISHAVEEDPNECCGILAGSDGTVNQMYRITNKLRSPYRYEMDPQEYYNAWRDSDDNGWEHLAFYHSHTHSPAYPSNTDVRMAQQSGMVDIYYVLVSLEDPAAPQIRAFHIDEDGEVTEEAPEIV